MIKKLSILATSVVAATVLGFGVPSQASASADAPIRDSQKTLLARHGIKADTLAPGWTLTDDEVVWGNGDVRASVSPAVEADCDSGYVCVWANANFGGRLLQFQAAGLRGSMADYSFNDQMSSWKNRRSVDARWYYNTDGNGTSRCMNDGTKNADVGAGASNFDNDEMSSLRIYTTSTSC